MLNYNQRVTLVALRMALGRWSAIIRASYVFGWSLTDARANMDVMEHSVIVDGQLIWVNRDGSFYLEDEDRQILLSTDGESLCSYFDDATASRRAMLRAALIELQARVLGVP